jgi:hypothetical protein
MATKIKAVASIIEWDAEMGRMAILNAGDEGEVGDALAEAKIAAGVAEEVDGDEPSAEDIADLRAQYEARTGKKPHHRWSAETLQAKIAEAADGDEPPA